MKKFIKILGFLCFITSFGASAAVGVGLCTHTGPWSYGEPIDVKVSTLSNNSSTISLSSHIGGKGVSFLSYSYKSNIYYGSVYKGTKESAVSIIRFFSNDFYMTKPNSVKLINGSMLTGWADKYSLYIGTPKINPYAKDKAYFNGKFINGRAVGVLSIYEFITIFGDVEHKIHQLTCK